MIISQLKSGLIRRVLDKTDNGHEDVGGMHKAIVDQIRPENSHDFVQELTIEPGEWFKIKPSDELKGELQQYFDCLKNSAAFARVQDTEYGIISSVVLLEEKAPGSSSLSDVKISITRVYPRCFSAKKVTLKWTGWPRIESQSKSVDIPNSVDAYWDGSNFFFKSIEHLKGILPSMIDLHPIATDQEKLDFLNKPLFALKWIDVGDIKQRNLKRIASVLRSGWINWDDKDVRTKYLDYAEKYGNKYSRLKIAVSNWQFELTNNNDISNVLNILEERIYTTSVTGRDIEAHSIIKLT